MNTLTKVVGIVALLVCSSAYGRGPNYIPSDSYYGSYWQGQSGWSGRTTSIITPETTASIPRGGYVGSNINTMTTMAGFTGAPSYDENGRTLPPAPRGYYYDNVLDSECNCYRKMLVKD
jgi:hypothetical protein